MASFSSIVVVNIREDGQPDLLQVIGENDTIADEVLSPEVRTAATKADEAITKANEVSGKNDEVSSYISTNETNWEAGLDATTRADIVSLSTTVLDSSTGWEEGLDTQTYNDIVTTSNALVGWQNTSGPAIKLSYESNADVTPFTPASATKFNGIQAGAEVNVYSTDSEIKTAYENNADVAPFTPTSATKFNGIEVGAEVNVYSTDSEIKTAYENNAGVAPFTTTSATKFNNIEDGATADQTDSEIETAYNTQVAQVGEDEKTDGIETGVRRFSPKDIADMAGTHGGGGGGGIPNPIDEDLDMDGFDIVNVDHLKGSDIVISGSTSVQSRAGWDGSNDATGTVTFVADNVKLRPNPSDQNGLAVNLGKGLLLTHASGVDISGAGGETVDDPPNGAALVYDAAASLFKWVRIGATNIGDGAILQNNLADGAVGSDKLATNAASDNIAAGALNSIAFNKLPLVNAESFVGNDLGYGGNMRQFTAATARSMINNGNQEITGNVGINTAATPTAPLQIEDTGTADAVYIESSDTGADAGPVITLKRDSASPAGADYLGQLKFKGESSTGVERVYAKITAKIDDPTNGSEDGALEIMNRFNGANQIAVRLKEDSFRLLNGVELHVDGNTGLGTNNPSEKLDVQGNIAVTGTVDGRDIAADGAKLDGIEGSYTVGTTAPTSPSEGDLWYDTTTDVDELFAYDSGRGKWLGVNSFCINAGRTGTIGSNVGHYGIMDNREMNTAVGTKRGFQVPFDCTVVGWAWSAGTDTSGFMHRLAKYDDSAGTSTTNIHTYSPAGVYDNWEQLNLDIDYDQRDIIGYSAIVASSPTGTIVNQNLTIVIKRRTS